MYLYICDIKHFIRRLSRVADSSNYTPLRSDSSSSSRGCRRRHRTESFRASKIRRSSAEVPEGHVPIYVGDEMERFVVCAELLNHPVFMKLLNESAQEYGYEQKGVIRLPCRVFDFERVLHALRLGLDAPDVSELVNFSPEEFS